MSASRYRQHDQVTKPCGTPLQRHVAEEWVRLNQDASVGLVLSRWAARNPVLAPMRRPADVVDAIDAGSFATKDELLRCLVELFQSGQQLAGRIALQAMLPKLAHYAFGTALLARIEACPDDRLHLVLCEFWDVLSTLPVQRRTTRLAANLALETLHRLTRMAPLPELPLDPAALPDLLDPGQDGGGAPMHQVEPASGLAAATVPDCDWDLDALVHWAVAQRVLTAEEAGLLRSVYASRGGSTLRDVSEAYRRQANSTGLSTTTLRQRARRARLRLTAAVAEQEPSAADG